MGISLQNLVLMDHEGVRVQPLDQAIYKFQARKGGYNEVTFTTEVPLDNSSVLQGGMKMEKLGLIVWLDRNKAQQLLDQRTPDGMDEAHAAPLRSLQLAIQEVLKVGAEKALPWGIDLQTPLDSLDELFGGSRG